MYQPTWNYSISLKSQKETLFQKGPVSPTPFFRVWKLPWRTCLCTTFVSSSPLGLVWSQHFFWACWRMSALAARIQQFLARTVFDWEWGNCKRCAEKAIIAWMELNYCLWPSILKVDSYVICLLFSTYASLCHVTCFKTCSTCRRELEHDLTLPTPWFKLWTNFLTFVKAKLHSFTPGVTLVHSRCVPWWS